MPQDVKFWGIPFWYFINIQAAKSLLPHQYMSDVALVEGGIFLTHFLGKNIRPSLTTSKGRSENI
jgi:hypothetical protein